MISPCQELLKGIEARYDEIIKGLGLELSLRKNLKPLQKTLKRKRARITRRPEGNI